MAKYKVRMSKTETYYATIEVEADSLRAAKQVAYNDEGEGWVEWEGDGPDVSVDEVELLESEDAEEGDTDEVACPNCGDVEELCPDCHCCGNCCYSIGRCNKHPNGYGEAYDNYKNSQVPVDEQGFRDGGLVSDESE